MEAEEINRATAIMDPVWTDIQHLAAKYRIGYEESVELFKLACKQAALYRRMGEDRARAENTMAPGFDTARLDALQKLTSGYGNGWILRDSTTGRGMRLHETSDAGAHILVRDAIDAYIAERRQREENQKK